MGKSVWIGQTILRSAFNQKQCSFWFFGGNLHRSCADIRAFSVENEVLDPMDPNLSQSFFIYITKHNFW